MPFENNVFVNCPFDNEYKPLLRAMVFTIIYLGFEPKLSETLSSSDIRINRIISLIKISKFGIHDLSRSKFLHKKELPRFNMPFELGLDMGCKIFGEKHFTSKKTLILETTKHHYDKVIGDISGQDVEQHEDSPEILILKIRNWLASNFKKRSFPGAGQIWLDFKLFMTYYLDEASVNLSQTDIEQVPIGEFTRYIKDWNKRFKSLK